MEFNILLFGLVVFLLSGMLQGLSGFGFSILAVPLITLIIPPKTAVPILLLYSIIINLVVLYSTRKSIDLKKIWILLLSGIAGLPFGAYLLIVLDAGILKIFIGGMIIVFGLLLLMGYHREFKHEKIAMIPIGLVSGLLSGSISISGPPIIIFLANKQLGKHSFRGNLAIYFFLLNIFAIPVFYFNHLFTSDVINLSLKFLPGLIVGVILGNLLSHKVQEKYFRNFTLILLLLMGILSVGSGLN